MVRQVPQVVLAYPIHTRITTLQVLWFTLLAIMIVQMTPAKRHRSHHVLVEASDFKASVFSSPHPRGEGRLPQIFRKYSRRGQDDIAEEEYRQTSASQLDHLEPNKEEPLEFTRQASAFTEEKLEVAPSYDKNNQQHDALENDRMTRTTDNLSGEAAKQDENKRGGVLTAFRKSFLFRRRQGETFVTSLTSRLLGKELSDAVKKIQLILTRFPDHGVIDVFAAYPAKDVVSAVLALSRLQHASMYEGDKKLLEGAEGDTMEKDGAFAKITPKHSKRSQKRNGSDEDDDGNRMNNALTNDKELLSNLTHYATYAHAAYGWKLGLVLTGKLHWGDLKTLINRTGTNPADVVKTRWKSGINSPAYFIVRDVKRKKIVLCIRGTLSPNDVLTVLCCTADDFEINNSADENSSQMDTKMNVNDADSTKPTAGSKHKARAHQGMLGSARGMDQMTRKLVASELEANPGFGLVIVGHSLGGGTAAILGTMWEDIFPGLVVYAYGCPCVAPLDAATTKNVNIISVVGEGDPFSRLSLGHLADITAAVSKLCESPELRNEIMERSSSKFDEMNKKDLKWCRETMEKLRKSMTAEKLYPPGRILLMGGEVNLGSGEVTLREVTQENFQNLNLHARMLDVSRHVPNRYESFLAQMSIKSEGAP